MDAEGDTLIPESVEVTANAPTCPWTATSQAAWLTILDNAKSTGSGSFDVAVAPNTGAARSGTVTVNGQTVEIDQSAGTASTCTYGLNPASAQIPAAGITGSFAVTTASSCAYFVEPYPQDSTYVTGVQFITIPQSSGLLVGNGNPQYTVAPNHGAPRTGAIMVGGDVFTLTQAAPTCYYTLDKTSADVGASGGSGMIGVTASGASCAWTAKSSDTSHLSVTAGATGTGNGTVKYTVPVNTAGPATPTITIGDANGLFTLYGEPGVRLHLQLHHQSNAEVSRLQRHYRLLRDHRVLQLLQMDRNLKRSCCTEHQRQQFRLRLGSRLLRCRPEHDRLAARADYHCRLPDLHRRSERACCGHH